LSAPKWLTDLCSAWTLGLRSGWAREGARPHASRGARPKRAWLAPMVAILWCESDVCVA
jgi:hypothetical protein